jgi:hypothetical protein
MKSFRLMKFGDRSATPRGPVARLRLAVGIGTAILAALGTAACGGSSKSTTSSSAHVSAAATSSTTPAATTTAGVPAHKAPKKHAKAHTTTSQTHTSTTHTSTTTAPTSTSTTTTTGSPAPAAPALVGPLHATLTGQNHAPIVNRPWPYTVSATDSRGHPLSGTVDIEFVFNGTVVGHDTPPSHAITNGRWHDLLEFPARSTGIPLQVQAVVHTKLGSTTLDWAVKVRR